MRSKDDKNKHWAFSLVSLSLSLSSQNVQSHRRMGVLTCSLSLLLTAGHLMHWSVRLCVGDVTISRANSQFVWDSCTTAEDDRSANLASLIFTCFVL